MSSKVWAGVLATAVVASGVALYLMAQENDEKEIAFDPKIHTKEKLIEILNQFEIEYASLYIHWYSMLKSKEKEVGKGNISLEVMEGAKRQLQKLTESVDEDVLKENGLTKKLFEDWVKRFEKDLEVKKLQSSLEENFELLLQIKKPLFKFEYPKEITKEKYIKFIKVSYAKFRYDTYHEVQKYMQEHGKNKLNDEEFNEIIQKCSLPAIKIAVYQTMMFPEVENEKPTKTALKAYLKMMEDDEAWHKDILHIQKDHKQILFSLAEGAKLQGMHEDPLEVLKAELKAEITPPQPKVVELAKEPEANPNPKPKPAPETVETQKKSVGAFSFLGSDEKQKKLVEDFINRNKKKAEPEVAHSQEDKHLEPEKAEESKADEDHKAEEKTDDHIEEVKADSHKHNDKHVQENDDKGHEDSHHHEESHHKELHHNEEPHKDAHHEELKQDSHHEHKDHAEPQNVDEAKHESHEVKHVVDNSHDKSSKSAEIIDEEKKLTKIMLTFKQNQGDNRINNRFNWNNFGQKVVYNAITPSKPRHAGLNRKTNSCLREPIYCRRMDSFRMQNFHPKESNPEAERIVEKIIKDSSIHSSGYSHGKVYKITCLTPVLTPTSEFKDGDEQIPNLLNNSLQRFEKVLKLLDGKVLDVQMIDAIDAAQDIGEAESRKQWDVNNAKIPLASEFYKQRD